jgi:hypothetical protein
MIVGDFVIVGDFGVMFLHNMAIFSGSRLDDVHDRRRRIDRGRFRDDRARRRTTEPCKRISDAARDFARMASGNLSSTFCLVQKMF